LQPVVGRRSSASTGTLVARSSIRLPWLGRRRIGCADGRPRATTDERRETERRRGGAEQDRDDDERLERQLSIVEAADDADRPPRRVPGGVDGLELEVLGPRCERCLEREPAVRPDRDERAGAESDPRAG